MPRGKIEFRSKITRQMLRDEPNTLFVFGDNLAMTGYGGQAKEMRGEPNAVGIPTKKRPSMANDAFFTDDDFNAASHVIIQQFAVLAIHLVGGGDIVWPKDGIGTGRAQLEQRAPLIHTLINRLLNAMVNDRG